MTDLDLATLAAFAHELADASGKAILPHFRSLDRSRASLTLKDGGYPDPVTEADLAAETAIRALIEERYPTHGILGEEHGSVRLDSDWVWVIDPIDGTAVFALGLQEWATLIGLTFRGRPVLGVIDQPVLRERWCGGPEMPTVYYRYTRDGSPVPTPSTEDKRAERLDQARLALSATAAIKMQDEAEYGAAKELAQRCQVTCCLVSGYTHGCIASGFHDAAVDSPDCEAFDVAAVAAVIAGAGGTVLDLGDAWEEAKAASGHRTKPQPLEHIHLKEEHRNYRAVVGRTRALAERIAEIIAAGGPVSPAPPAAATGAAAVAKVDRGQRSLLRAALVLASFGVAAAVAVAAQ